jgi:nitrogen regulatory protein P-II 2
MGIRTLHLVTIVCGVSVEPRLLRDLKRLGVTGYTCSLARGEGRLSIPDEWEGNNARIEALVSLEVAELVLARLEESYLPHHPIVAWTHEVRALIAEGHVETP